MREILFKAKETDTGKWVEGYIVKKCENTYQRGFEMITKEGINYDDLDYFVPNFISHEVDTKTICQYTGLTDKNGNKIWENDVVKDNVIFGTVVWDEKNARFMIDDIHDGLQEYSDWWHEVEVIGNIFDNPELLTTSETTGQADNGGLMPAT